MDSPTVIGGGAGLLTIIGLLVKLIIDSSKKTGTNGYVRSSTCEATKQGLQNLMESHYSELSKGQDSMNAKIDKIYEIALKNVNNTSGIFPLIIIPVIYYISSSI